MNKLSNIYYFYKDGFTNLTLGKTLWKIIILKLIIILVFLKLFVYDKNINTDYKTDYEKANFVLENLTKDKYGS